ncbi:DNA-binding NarL/FixJ family response regulator OS=Streptomyces albaduncus OX=68172 GN=FHS32_004617 PE=4 SV=1 [Streptomyces griseoloalbus]
MNDASPTRILLADDHALVRRGVRLILDGEPDLTVVAEAADGAEALELAREHRPDLAILDIAMPRLTGLQAARELSRTLPEIRLLVLTMYDNEQFFFEALAAGASVDVRSPSPTATSSRPATPPCAASPSSTRGRSTPSSTTTSTSPGTAGPLPAKAITDREEQILKLVARSTPRSRSRTCW